jgi:hypothetical protein
LDQPCLASNSDAVITFFATVEDDALARTMLWVTPCENDSESLPLFSLLYATLGDDDSEEEDFGTTLMTTMTMLSLFYFVDDLDIRLRMFRRLHPVNTLRSAAFSHRTKNKRRLHAR